MFGMLNLESIVTCHVSRAVMTLVFGGGGGRKTTAKPKAACSQQQPLAASTGSNVIACVHYNNLLAAVRIFAWVFFSAAHRQPAADWRSPEIHRVVVVKS